MKKAILIFLMVLSSVVTSADELINGIYYKLNSSSLTAEVTDGYGGDSEDDDTYSGKVNIPSSVTYNGTTYSVTSISKYAFYGCEGLTSVTIGNCVTSIGDHAFQSTGLTSITVPNSVTSIGDYAFQSCTGLTRVTIGNCVTSIGDYAFSYCSGLTSVTIPSSVTYIGQYAFRNTGWYNNKSNGLLYLSNWLIGYKGNKPSGALNISTGTKGIASYAFFSCSELTSVTIPSSVRNIGKTAFRDCTGLTSITFQGQINCYDYAFYGCNVTSIYITDLAAFCGSTFYSNSNPVWYDGHLFVNGTEVTELVIPNTVTSIGRAVFIGFSFLTKLTIGNNVTSIGERAFQSCYGLTSVTIGNSVKTIEQYAFTNCNFTSVIIPESVEYIGYAAFNSDHITKLKVERTTPPTLNYNYSNLKLYVPKGCRSKYAYANYWKNCKQIKEYPDGDVNEDGETDVVDVVDIARFVVNSPRTAFEEFLADINSDNEINIADAVVLVNEIAGDTQFAKPAFAPRKAAGDVLTLYGDGSNLSMQMEGTGDYTAFQFDLWLPTDMDMMQVSLNEARRQGHQLLYNKLGDGHYRVVVLSTSSNVFSGTSGELLSMTLDDFATDDVRIDNIHFVTARGVDVPFEAIGVSYGNGGVTTDIRSIDSKSTIIQPIYNLNGQRLTAPRKGLNIVGGKKFVVK